MRSREKARPLSIFLLKQDSSAKIQKSISMIETAIRLDENTTGTLCVRPSEEHTPSWLSFLSSAIDSSTKLINSNSAAVLFVPVEGREFAITFGYGRNLLIPGCWEENFGLRVTLNSVDPERIRSVDRTTFDTISKQSQIQASREASISDFGLDVEQDLLRSVTGKPRAESFGVTLTGKDALNTKVQVSLKTLPQRLAAYLKAFADNAYKENFPWVDHISALKDPQKVANLDELLISRLRARDFDRLWLAVPDPITWTTVAGFRYRDTSRAEVHDDLHISDFVSQYDILSDLSITELKHRQIHMINSETDLSVQHWPVYKCIYAEIEEGDKHYLLNNGKWYLIAATFMDSVNESVSAVYDRSWTLPMYSDASEEKYNARIADQNAELYALMDQKFIYAPGEAGKVEFCDLYSGQRELIHVKRYGGSSTLSHLFAQGLTSATLLSQDSAFRESVNELLPEFCRLANCQAKLQPDQYTIVFAVVSKSTRDLRLPFFSRVNLRNVARQLHGAGFKVILSKISVDDGTNRPKANAQTAPGR